MRSSLDGPQAFPSPLGDPGMSLRDWFATHAPMPTEAQMELERNLDRRRNPHNDPYKPPIREDDEIIAQRRYRYADAMLKARQS